MSGIVMGKRIVGRPRIVTVGPGGVETGRGGLHCFCCQCCTCVHFEFIRTVVGKLKLAEVIIASICQSLVINYGQAHARTLGTTYDGFLTTVASCLLTSIILLFCYLFSEKTQGLVRSSLFEPVFNAVAAFLYLSSASYLSYGVNIFLRPLYIVQPFFEVYPAMTACYIMGLLLGVIHGYDAYLAYRQFRGYT
ncbi:protein singles bar [Periplaneta americana]|uniref:protein singles bar n=1 Tax=Periplaneta americana TaxID=6978 RepID=UPI0037E813AD